MKEIPDIVRKNLDIEHIMHASCKYGYHYAGVKNSHKLFSLLISADIHHDSIRLERSVDYLNYYEALDGAICLGDIMAENFNEDDGSWYTGSLLKSEKPYLTVIGNHDMGNGGPRSISATRKEAYEKFILPTDEKMKLNSDGKSYYVKYFDKYKLALIVLCNYDMSDELSDKEHFKVSHSAKIFSQEQIDWLSSTLLNMPKDHTVLIAMHAIPFPVKTVECPFTQQNPEEPASVPTSYGEDNLLCDLIDAYKNGKKIDNEYKPLESYRDILPTLSVKADFTLRGDGLFACYIAGHTHEDFVLKSEKYSDQVALIFPSSSAHTWQNYCSDLPRAEGTKAEDCLTVLSLETEKREIRLVRVGSNFTLDMKERTYTVIDY